MRVLLVNDFFPPHAVGGAETLVQGLAAALQDRGHTVAVAVARVAGSSRREAVQGIDVYRLGNFPAFERSVSVASGSAPQPLSAPVAGDLDDVLDSFQPDVVHYHNVWLLGPAIIARGGPRRGVTLHDYWPICHRRSLLRVDWRACPGPGIVACRMCKLRAPATWRSLDLLHVESERDAHAHLLRSCDFVTAPSRFLATRVRDVTGFEPAVVYNGIQADEPAEDGAETGRYAFFGSRTTREKGYDLAVEAFARPELRHLELRVAGPPTADSAPNIRWLGRQPMHRMRQLISSASCVVVPSIWPENCPMIVLEALACGVPVVASDIGGLPELLDDGVTGILVPPGSAEALAAAIRRCGDDVQLRANARRLGPISVRERFSHSHMISRFEHLYAA